MVIDSVKEIQCLSLKKELFKFIQVYFNSEVGLQLSEYERVHFDELKLEKIDKLTVE